ncbi:hypothetical protein GCM10027347_59130 [Larkinella harenae]
MTVQNMPGSYFASLEDRIINLETNPAAPAALQAQVNGKADKTYVDQRFTDLLNAAPATLDTLKELSDALGNDANFAATMTASLAQKANLSVTSSLANRITNTENRITGTEGRLTELESWRANKRPYMGRLTGSMTGLSLTVLGLSVAGSGLIDRVSEIITYINTKVAPALEAREITAVA